MHTADKGGPFGQPGGPPGVWPATPTGLLITIPPQKFYLAVVIYLTPFTFQFWVSFSALFHLLTDGKRGNFEAVGL